MVVEAKPLELWDRNKGKLVEEWMPDHQTTYETKPLRSAAQWVRATPLFDKLYALYQDAPWTVRQIEPFVREYHIEMSEFEAQIPFLCGFLCARVQTWIQIISSE